MAKFRVRFTENLSPERNETKVLRSIFMNPSPPALINLLISLYFHVPETDELHSINNTSWNRSAEKNFCYFRKD